MMFGLIPKEEAFFELFKKAAHNMIEGSRLLKEMMEDLQSPVEQARITSYNVCYTKLLRNIGVIVP